MSRLVYLVPLLVLLIGIGAVFGDVVSSLTIVVYKDGVPLSDATVELWYNGTLVYRGVTDVNGTVTFTNVATGEYTIYVYYAGKSYAFVKNITNTTTEIELNIVTYRAEFFNDTSADTNTTTTTTTTTATNNSTNTTNILNQYVDQITDNKYLLYSGIAIFLIILLLIAYAVSGKRIPHRR